MDISHRLFVLSSYMLLCFHYLVLLTSLFMLCTLIFFYLCTCNEWESCICHTRNNINIGGYTFIFYSLHPKKQVILGFKNCPKKQVILSYLESACACKNQLVLNMDSKQRQTWSFYILVYLSWNSQDDLFLGMEGVLFKEIHLLCIQGREYTF